MIYSNPINEPFSSAFVSHIRPIIDFGSVVWNLGYQSDLTSLENIQRRWTKRVEGLALLPYHERLARLDLFSIRGRLMRTDLILVWRIANGLCPHLLDLFTFSFDGRTRGHSKKICIPNHHTDLRSKFFSIQIGLIHS